MHHAEHLGPTTQNEINANSSYRDIKSFPDASNPPCVERSPLGANTIHLIRSNKFKGKTTGSFIEDFSSHFPTQQSIKFQRYYLHRLVKLVNIILNSLTRDFGATFDTNATLPS